MKVIKKIAFLVHEPTMYAHYSSVWSLMDKNSFVIILCSAFLPGRDGCFGVQEFYRKIDKNGYEVHHLEDLIRKKIKYQYVVSNHILGGTSVSKSKESPSKLKNTIKIFCNYFFNFCKISKKYQISIVDSMQYLPLQTGLTQIRFMYGADISDAWSLDSWNEIYDLFLCHGNNDAKHLKQRFRGRTEIMGYPRYDAYFYPISNYENIITEFNINPEKKTILWMPTMDVYGDEACSISTFAENISKLMGEFNVIVRPHPISLRKEPDLVKLLESFNYKIDRDPTRDMNSLFKLADFVFCDHGGSAFGALYLGKNLVILRTPKYFESVMAKGSTNHDLMKYFPVISVDDLPMLRGILRNDIFWKEAIHNSRSLCDKYFANFRGTSSKTAAQILNDLLI